MKTVIRNIGQIISGDIARPLLDGDTIVIAGRSIEAVGKEGEVEAEEADLVVDAHGSTVTPGLLDSHVHPTLADFTPRQRTLDFIASELQGGVTTMISAGEVHVPGRPRDAVGIKALAIVAQRIFSAFRPGGAKVLAGAPIPELDLTEEDFAEMAKAGVRLVGEIGLGSVRTGPDAARVVRWAKKYGMTATFHTGGPSIAGSSPIDARTVLEARPHVVGHINGGHTALSNLELEALARSDMALEIVHCGNMKAALHVLKVAQKSGGLHRLIIGNDAPSGTGVVPLGVLRVLSLLSGVGGLDPAVALCCATGNTARVYNLPVGVIAPRRPADLVVMDAPIGSVGKDALSALAAGDLPGVSMVLVDGEVCVGRSRNTPPAARAAEVTKGHMPPALAGGH
ncbi:MAG: amidohydrolase family protein [Chloroflexi bacterium]|nr:amidohydrolase family protein [Chloroflexota bacterium]